MHECQWPLVISSCFNVWEVCDAHAANAIHACNVDRPWQCQWTDRLTGLVCTQIANFTVPQYDAPGPYKYAFRDSVSFLNHTITHRPRTSFVITHTHFAWDAGGTI